MELEEVIGSYASLCSQELEANTLTDANHGRTIGF